jgi:hypothetical protein
VKTKKEKIIPYDNVCIRPRNTPCEEEVIVLPVRGDAHSAFVALAAHTRSRENEVQLVVYGVRPPLHPFSAREIQEKGHDDEYTYRCKRTE